MENMINMIKILKKNMNIMRRENINKSQMTNTICDIRNSLNWIISRLDIAEDIVKLEDTIIKATHTEAQQKKNLEKKIETQ